MAFIDAALGALLVFAATALGSLIVYFVDCMDRRVYSVLLSFASGVMLFSALEMSASAGQSLGLVLAAAFVLIGAVGFVAFERSMPHLHVLRKSKLAGDRNAPLVAGAVTLHNIPEGIAIGSAFASSTPLGWLVSVSMALQDIPEGLSVSAPLACFGMQKHKSLLFGILSGFVEAVFAVIGYCFLVLVAWVVPYGLAISAGAMFAVVFIELLPDAFKHGQERTAALCLLFGLAVAFVLGSIVRF